MGMDHGGQYVPDDRYRLHDGPLLKRLMKQPIEGGLVYTVRSLAERVGLSYSKIQKLVKEDRPTVSEDEADRIAKAVQANRKALFSPTPSPFEDGDTSEEEPRGPR
jgi:hypothetical protein